MQNRLDEMFDQWIDKLCEGVPAIFRKLYLKVGRTHLGWHILLFFNSLGRKMGDILKIFSSDEEMNRFLSEFPARFIPTVSLIAGNRDQEHDFHLSARGTRFRMLLALLILSAFGVAFSSGPDMAVCALSLALSFLGSAVSLPYRPISGNLRQIFVEGRILYAASFTVLLGHWFRQYLRNGIASNIFLQSAMLIALILHFSVFLAVIAFNRRQHLFLRLLDGLTGILPALAAAAATSLLPQAISGEGAAAALACALAAWMLFASDRIESLEVLGGITVHFGQIITGALTGAGYFLLLVSAWQVV